MKKRAWFRISALLLCAALAFSACGILEPFGLQGFWGGQNAKYPIEHFRERRTIPFEEMPYARPDVEQVKAELLLQTGNIQAAQSYGEWLAAVEAGSVVLEDFYTMHSLAELNSYRFVTDPAHEEEFRWMSEAAVEVGVLATDLDRAIVQSGFAAQYRTEVGEHYFQYLEDGLRLNSPEVEAYKKQREQLTADYTALLTGGTIEWEGSQYTLEQLAGLPGGNVLAFYDEMAPRFAELYAQLIELDKLTAQTLGFESPADMYYLGYVRDYTAADALALCDNVKRVFTPMLYDALGISMMPPGVSLEEAFAKMPVALGRLDEELAGAFEFMVSNRLYDCEAREGKHPGIVFTANILAYDAPFIYQYWDDSSFYSATTLMHEFGHFYDFWLRYDIGSIVNLDVAETYSQGMELLLQPAYGDFLPEADAEDARLAGLASLLVNSLVYQSILEEFQIRAYALDSIDDITLGRLFEEVMVSYGLGGLADENGANNTWLDVTHLFDTPFYTISYVTSALAALQIWSQSREDHGRAVQTYMELIHADQNQPFAQLLDNAGLDSVHRRGTMQDIADEMQAVFDGERDDASGWFDSAA